MFFSDACFKDFQLICQFACLVCFQLPPAFFTTLLRTSRRAQFDILSRFLEIVLLDQLVDLHECYLQHFALM